MIKIETSSLDYHKSLQDTYQKLTNLPGFVLLESTDKTQGRYDILSAYPYKKVVIDENTDNFSTILEDLTAELSVYNSNCDLPFQGGAIGYISYDFGARLLGFKSQAQETLKNMPLLDLGFYDWAIIVDHYKKSATLVTANRHSSTSEIAKEIIKLWQESSNESKQFTIENEFASLISFENYKNSFNFIINALKEGRTYQVNYTQPFHAGFSGDTWSIYKAVSKNNPVPYSAFLKMDGSDILSFSPERFLLWDKGLMLTSPIKGTIGRSHDPAKDAQLKNQLELCSKNRAENVMIVDLLRNDLGKIAKPGTVTVGNLCQIQSYNSVHHLVSDVRAECIATIRPFEAFLSCFPGGSITGAPKFESMKIINELEPFGRGVYCGSVGYFSNHGRFDTNISIRTVIARENILHLAAGGGIVIDSNLEDEYRECYTKIKAIINGLK